MTGVRDLRDRRDMRRRASIDGGVSSADTGGLNQGVWHGWNHLAEQRNREDPLTEGRSVRAGHAGGPALMADVSLAEARRIALIAQGFGRPRPVNVDRAALAGTLDRMALVQIDSVNVVARAHYLAFFSRLGPYSCDELDGLAYEDGAAFEYWGHMASLIPIGQYGLFRHRMEARHARGRAQTLIEERPGYIESVLRAVRESGPLTASQLPDAGERTGSWWGYSPGKIALEWLFARGDVSVRRRVNFTRHYDLTERVIPAGVRSAPAPGRAEAHRSLLQIAARAHGIGTDTDLADYHRLPPVEAKTPLNELVDEGLLRRVSVEGWAKPAYMPPDGAATAPPVEARALLSPFDPVVWNRDRASRLFGFDYRIEIYVPARKRRYGYYVLPFLMGDRLVARVDLKTDRSKGRLLARGAFAEDGCDTDEVAAALADELRQMARWLRLERVVVGRRGSLGDQLRREVKAGS